MKDSFHSRRWHPNRLTCAFTITTFVVTVKILSAETNTGRVVHFREPHAKRYVLIEHGGQRRVQFKSGYWRLSWPARETTTYSVMADQGLTSTWTALTNRAGSLPTAEYVVNPTNRERFFRVFRQ